jgi:hypothetical protein
MHYLKGILSGLAAFFLACLAFFWPVFRHLSGQTAVGLDLFSLGFSSPVLWILAFLFFALFFSASRIKNTLLNTFLFWIPAVMLSTFVVAFLLLFAYALVRFRHS